MCSRSMSVDRYLKFRLGPGTPGVMVWNMLARSFTAPSLRAFWWNWNPGYGYYLLTYCYQPLRKVFPHSISVLFTFLACGFFLHDILYLVPMVLAGEESLPIPFVTCWFLLIGIGVAVTETLRVNFSRVRPSYRVPIHLGFLATTFALTYYASSLL